MIDVFDILAFIVFAILLAAAVPTTQALREALWCHP
jgi:hypothetical protein